jgi:hypothetical protein
MQNSYGRLEQSYMKCSPIFPGMTSDTRGKEQNSELIQNFPLSSMLQNKAAVIRSNFDLNADMMTPYYKRADLFEQQEGNDIPEGQEGEAGLPEPREAPALQNDKGPMNARTSQGTNPNQQGVNLSSSLFGGLRATNSAFLLNYKANAKAAAQPSDSGPGNIQNSFSHIYSNLNNNFNGLKPHSSIFLRKNMESQKNTPVNLTIINNNNYNMQNFQPKIREVIKIAGYERDRKKINNKKSGLKSLKSLESKTSKIKKGNDKSGNEKLNKKKGKISKLAEEEEDESMISSIDDEEKNYSESLQSDQEGSASEEKQYTKKKKEMTRKQKKKNTVRDEEKIEIVVPCNRIEKLNKNKLNKKKNANVRKVKVKSVIKNDQANSDVEMGSCEVEENSEENESEEMNESSLEESENSEQSQSENSDEDQDHSEEDDYISNSLPSVNEQHFLNRKKKPYQEKKTKSIRDLVDSTKKFKDEKRPKGRKQPEEEKEKVYVFNNIETNKFTKRIVEDTINRNFSNIHYNKGDYESSYNYGGLNNLK